MKIIIKTININLTDKEKDVMEEKLTKLDRFLTVFHKGEDEGLNPPAEVDVTISRETNHHLKGPIFKTAINLVLPGKTLRVEEQDESVNLSFQKAKEEAEREVKKYKGKRQSIIKKGMLSIKKKLKRK